MKLHVLSDLHLEFADFTPISNSADVIDLAGDIDLGSHGITWARKSFPTQEIIYPIVRKTSPFRARMNSTDGLSVLDISILLK